MKPYFSLNGFAIAILLFLTTTMTYADEWSGHISMFIGLKSMKGSDWPKLSRHFAMGIIADIKKDAWPISIALDVMDTGDKHEHEGMTDLGHTTEYHLGVRKIIMNQNSKLQPYLGGGVSFMYAELEHQENNTVTTQDDRDVGGWLGTGMYYEINPAFVLGVDVRYSRGKVTLFNKEREAGGVFTGVTGGFQF